MSVIHIKYSPPFPYASWKDYFNNAPVGSVFYFNGETTLWKAVGNGNWQAGENGLTTRESHLKSYVKKGVILEVEIPLPGTQVGPSNSALVELENYVNQKIEEAYERGRKDGYQQGYDNGYNDAGHYDPY